MRNRYCGVRIYSGDTQFGKTTLAEAHASEANAAGQPYLILDRMPAKNWIGKEHVNDPKEVIRRLFGKPAQNVICSPQSEDDLNWILAKVHQGGCLGESRTVLYDECALDQSPNYISNEASQAIRGWAHSGNLFLLVTQRFHELNGVIYVTTPCIRVFHTEHDKSLERIREELRLDVEKIKKLPRASTPQATEAFEIYGRDQ